MALEAGAEHTESPLWHRIPVDQDPVRQLLNRRVPWITHGDTFSSQLMGNGAWPGQGWKLHVSATPRNAVGVLSGALDVLIAEGARFKVVGSLRMLAAMNSGMFAKSQIGKFITVYPSDDAQAVRLAVDLDRVTRGQNGPRVPTDRVLRPASLVHYRYGAMRLSESTGETAYDLLDPAGRLTHDVRLGYYQPPSRDVIDPFEAAGVREPPRPRGRFLNGRYLVTDALAQSARGGVFRAVDVRSQPPRLCLVKESWHDVALDPFGRDARDWAVNEQAILSGHPEDAAIPEFFDSFELDGDRYLVIEYVEGLTIERLLIDRDSADASMDLPEIVAAGLATADALAHLHEIGVVFRDFKPANVVRTPSGDYRLIDFGIAFEFRTSRARPLSIGTPPFYSPEQYAGNPPCPADDIFSWGAVLHFLFAGPQSINEMRSGDDILEPFQRRPLSELCSAPDELTGVIDRAVAWEPRDRYATMRDAKDALAAAAHTRRAAGYAGDRVAARTQAPTLSPASAELPPAENALRRAREVGDALCAAAEEHGGGLRWVRRFEHGDDIAYDPDLYGGAAGIGLFMAELAKATGDDRYAAAARGAARWLGGSTWARGRAQHGFHSGEAGIAHFFVRVAELLAAPGYLDAAVIRLRRLRGSLWQTADIMYGVAGTLLGALSVYTATGEPEFLGDALAAAEHLESERLWAPGGGCYWEIAAANLGGPVAPYLGFLHGSAGIGFAFACLAQTTGEQRYLDIAAAAADLLLANARPIDDSPALTWPRQLGDNGHGVQALCHGAGGIGQFMLFLDRVIPDRRYHNAAVGAAWAMASKSMQETRSGVCHGLSGAGHFFLDIYQSEISSRWLGHACECVHRLEDFGVKDRPGEYSINQGKAVSPDLMIGYAGVGGFQLRLADPAGVPEMVLGRLTSALKR